MFREVHGVADAKKIMMVGETDDRPVTIKDLKNGNIEISVGDSGASITKAQAKFLADQLNSAILRKAP